MPALVNVFAGPAAALPRRSEAPGRRACAPSSPLWLAHAELDELADQDAERELEGEPDNDGPH
jgi:hypothetical protein